MMDIQQGQLRYEELLREAELHRRRQLARPLPSHNYLRIARNHVAQMLIPVGQFLVRRVHVPHEVPLRRRRT